MRRSSACVRGGRIAVRDSPTARCQVGGRRVSNDASGEAEVGGRRDCRSGTIASTSPSGCASARQTRGFVPMQQRRHGSDNFCIASSGRDSSVVGFPARLLRRSGAAGGVERPASASGSVPTRASDQSQSGPERPPPSTAHAPSARLLACGCCSRPLVESGISIRSSRSRMPACGVGMRCSLPVRRRWPARSRAPDMSSGYSTTHRKKSSPRCGRVSPRYRLMRRTRW
jgi:hypothetical protein